MLNLKETFDKFGNEYLSFQNIERRLSYRRDVHAFTILDEMFDGNAADIICCADHERIWLEPSCEELAKKATESFILDLVRCGVLYDDEEDSLFMFA